jgi:hypothetical protein
MPLFLLLTRKTQPPGGAKSNNLNPLIIGITEGQVKQPTAAFSGRILGV